MNKRQHHHLNRLTGVGLLLIAALVALAHVTDEPVREDAGQAADTVTLSEVVADTPPRPDWRRIARRNGRRFAECHEQLVEHQDRLRQLGHVYSEKAHGWVRVGRE